jgi:tetratricopeptide (TPR) repeat protein
LLLFVGCLFYLAGCSSKPSTPSGSPVSAAVENPVLEEKFNQGNRLLKAEKYEEALVLFQEIALPLEKAQYQDMFSNLFSGMVELRRTACLIHLGRLDEAKVVLESRPMHFFMKAFDSATTFDYFYEYGNVLGSLKKIDTMDSALRKALSVAAEELEDPEKCQQVWDAILKWGKSACSWDYLGKQALHAQAFGLQNDDILIQHNAEEAKCYADVGLKRSKEARKEIIKTIQRMKKNHEPADKIEEFQEMLRALPQK